MRWQTWDKMTDEQTRKSLRQRSRGEQCFHVASVYITAQVNVSREVVELPLLNSDGFDLVL